MKAFSGILGAAAGVALLALGAATAGANVEVTGTVTKNKTKDVTETVTIEKTITIGDRYFDRDKGVWVGTPIEVTPTLSSVAESQIAKNQDNMNVQVDNLDETGSDSTATISDGAADGSGISFVNQSPGNLNNQANEASMVAASNGGGGLVHSEVAVQQKNTDNTATTETLQTKKDIITHSAYTETEGMMGVNQAANDLNNQNNAVSVALDLTGYVALGEIDLGQANTNNEATLTGTDRLDEVSGGPRGGTTPRAGIFQFSQSAGPINNQSNVVNVAIGSNALP